VSEPVKVFIRSFDPLEISFPNEPLCNRVWLMFPELHFKLIDLSLGRMIPDNPYIGGDAPLLRYEITIPDGEELPRGKLFDFITNSQNELKELWQAYQNELDKRFLLDETRKRQSQSQTVTKQNS
jgi:hypothetical protein